MMKQRTSFLTRCLAMALALVLLVSSANLGVALQAFAAEKTVVTAGELVANNYKLTEAEKNLLNSGMLTGGTVEYTVPSDSNLVAIDSDNKAISAQSYENWVPTTADVVVNGETVETVTLTDGKGNYTYDGNAFSAVVTYELTAEVEEGAQEILLNAAANLKQGVANLDAVAAQSGNLYILEQAMPTLVDIADNGIAGLLYIKDEAIKTAIYDMESQVSANGELDLSTMIADYNDCSSKTDYLVHQGTAMQAEVVALYENVGKLHTLLVELEATAKTFFNYGFVKQEELDSLSTLTGIVGKLKDGLTAPAEDSWTAANLGTELVKADAVYPELDVLVAALEDTTANAVKNPLNVATTTVSANLAMFDVNVEVILNTVKGDVDSAELVEAAKSTYTLTLGAGVTAEEIEMALADGQYVQKALENWEDAGLIVLDKFAGTASKLPATLEEDITYTVVYNPIVYTVESNYAEAMMLPYGYQLTLPVSPNEAQSFDYTVNGESCTEGSVITITGDTVINRSVGKAYIATDLYTVIAGNYSEGVAAEILTSGALNNNVAVSYRAPEIGDVQLELTLDDKVLTAKPYDSSYAGLNWNAYSYNGNLFNGAVSADWIESSATVVYRLDLTNTSVEEVKAILALPQTLREEAAAQNNALLRLMGENNANYNNMASLSSTAVVALSAIIDVTTLNDNPAKDAALKTEFKAVFGDMKANCFDDNGYLTMYNLLNGYTNNGLIFYYQNSEATISALNELSGYVSKLLAEDSANNLTKADKELAMQKLCGAAGPAYAAYADKIFKLEQVLTEVKADLKAPNAAIDLTSKNLVALVNMLESEEEIKVAEDVSYAYITSSELPVVSDDMVFASVTVQMVNAAGIPTKSITVNTDPVWLGESYDVAALETKVNEAIASIVGSNGAFYTCTVEGGSLEDLEGAQYSNVKITYTYSVKNFKVQIAGEVDQYVSINDLVVDLPKHADAAYEYRYTVNGVYVGTKAQHLFTISDLIDLFVDGVFTITRTAVNLADEKLEEALGGGTTTPEDPENPDVPVKPAVPEWIIEKNEKGEIVALTANKATNDVVSIAQELALIPGVTAVKLGGKYFVTTDGALQVSLQTLIDTMLSYEKFNTQMVIDLANNNGGTVLETDMVLVMGSIEKTVDFTLNLTDCMPELKQVAGYMDMVKEYVSFRSNPVATYGATGATENHLLIEVTLPDKVYEAYVAGLLATSELDVKDVNVMDSEVAIRVFYDYFDTILNSDANTTTYTNTLQMLRIDKDLTGYETRYQQVKSLLLGDRVEINSVKDDGAFDLYMAVMGQGDIDKLLNFAGYQIPDLYKTMIKEYSDEGMIEVNTVFSLTNTLEPIEAFVVDPMRDGLNTEGGVSKEGALNILNSVKNKIAFSNDFVADSALIAGPAAIVLMDDIEGDLVFNHITVIDLNGKTINGNLVANDNVLIMDSSLDSSKCGGVTGNVSGDVTIISGNYNVDVTAYLMDGYKQNGTSVSNALFKFVTDDKGNLTVVVNTDYIYDECVSGYVPSMKALAAEIALDVVMNYYASAGLTAEGDEIYGFNFRDLVGVVGSETPFSDAINMVLGCIDAPGFSNLINTIVADLLDFGAIETALTKGETVATYHLSTAAIELNVEHVEDGDYITIGAYPDYTKGKDFDLSLVFEGENRLKLAKVAGALDEVKVKAVAEIHLDQPYYADRTLWLKGTAMTDSRWDLTVDDRYVTALILVLAKGHPANEEALLAALDSGDQAALKAEFDKLNIEDVCNVLKEISKEYNIKQTVKTYLEKVPYIETAKSLLAKLHLDDEAKWDRAFSLIRSGAEKVLNYLRNKNITTKTIGGLDKDNDGIYGGSVDGTVNPDVNFRGFGVDACASADVTLLVNLFGVMPEEEDCLWGDANHDDVVDEADAALVARYTVGLPIDGYFCTERTDVNADGFIDEADAAMIARYTVGLITKFPAED